MKCFAASKIILSNPEVELKLKYCKITMPDSKRGGGKKKKKEKMGEKPQALENWT